MHEYSLIQSLVSRVEEEARARNALCVHRLAMRVGELSGVDPELLQTAYDTFRAGTICEKAELTVTRVKARWTCPQCEKEIAAGEALQCPACGVAARLCDGGDALMLDSIELEVP